MVHLFYGTTYAKSTPLTLIGLVNTLSNLILCLDIWGHLINIYIYPTGMISQENLIHLRASHPTQKWLRGDPRRAWQSAHGAVRFIISGFHQHYPLDENDYFLVKQLLNDVSGGATLGPLIYLFKSDATSAVLSLYIYTISPLTINIQNCAKQIIAMEM